MFTNGILLHRASGRPPNLLGTGAASFKRWLGCAPQIIARAHPRQERRGALTVPALAPRSRCRMDLCSDPTSPAAPRAQRDFHLGSGYGSNRTGPTDAGSDIETDQVGFH